MAESILIQVLGAPMVLDLEGLDAAEAQAVRDAWIDAVSPASDASAPDGVTVVRAREEGSHATTGEMLERLSQRVTLEAITARRGELWMLHAAGLALPDGRVVVLVGPSGRGKTTAALTLGADLGYVSDESVGVDAEGRVVAYRKPLSVIERPGSPKAQRSPSSLGLGALPVGVPLRLGAVVLLDRRDDAPEFPLVEALDLGDALGELVPQTSFLASVPRPLALMADLIAPLGGIRRVTYREAADLRALIPDLVGDLLGGAAGVDSPLGAGIAGAFPHEPATEADDGEFGRDPALDPALDPEGAHVPRYRRVPYADAVALADPDRIALLHVADEGGDDEGAAQVRVIAGIAPALWRAAAAATRDQLVAAAVAAYGAPEGMDAGALVDAALRELVEAGLLHVAASPPDARGESWRVRDDVAWQDGDGRIVAVALGGSDAEAVVLEGSAAALWRALADAPGSTPAALAVAVHDDPSAIAGDVVMFLEDLARRGLADGA